MFKLVPYAEPSWLSPAYQSPYYNDVCSIISFTLTQHLLLLSNSLIKLCKNG